MPLPPCLTVNWIGILMKASLRAKISRRWPWHDLRKYQRPSHAKNEGFLIFVFTILHSMYVCMLITYGE